jgi:hypothetical protein
MDIDITELVTTGETWGYSGSIATHGPNAARITWEAAKREAARRPLLNTRKALRAMREWMRESGAWDNKQIAAVSFQELNALFIQLVASDMRECGLEECDIDDFNWGAYQKRASEGRISGNLFLGYAKSSPKNPPGIRRVFYYLGN